MIVGVVGGHDNNVTETTRNSLKTNNNRASVRDGHSTAGNAEPATPQQQSNRIFRVTGFKIVLVGMAAAIVESILLAAVGILKGNDWFAYAIGVNAPITVVFAIAATLWWIFGFCATYLLIRLQVGNSILKGVVWKRRLSILRNKLFPVLFVCAGIASVSVLIMLSDTSNTTVFHAMTAMFYGVDGIVGMFQNKTS